MLRKQAQDYLARSISRDSHTLPGEGHAFSVERKCPGFHSGAWSSGVNVWQAHNWGGHTHNTALQPLGECLMPVPALGQVAGEEGAPDWAVQEHEEAVLANPATLLHPFQCDLPLKSLVWGLKQDSILWTRRCPHDKHSWQSKIWMGN